MKSGILILLVVCLPLMLGALLIGPLYAGMCVGLLAYYGEEASQYFYEPDNALDIYINLYQHWQNNQDALGFSDFTLPVFGPLLGGALVALLLTFFFGRYIRTILILIGRS